MNKSSKSKKRFKSIVSLLLVAAILITGALAYLTATDSKENKFTVGNVSIELTEPNWNEENGKNIVPGETIAKDPQIENTGLNDAYVYIMVTVPKKDQITVNENGSAVVKDNLQLFTYDVNENWTLINSKSDDANENNYYVYAYNTTLTPNVTTEPLFTEVTFANIVSDQISSTEELEILVNGYAIQSNSVYNAEGEPATAEEAWDIYATQNGWDWPIEIPDGYSSLSFVNEQGTVVHTEVAEAGTPVDMYFDNTLAKDGFTFDWVDSSTNEVAYSGMPMPENDTELEASYTEISTNDYPSDFLQYQIVPDGKGGYNANLWTALADHPNFPSEVIDLTIPSFITVTGVGDENVQLTSPDGEVAGSLDTCANLNGTIEVPVVHIVGMSLNNLSSLVKTLSIPDTVKIVDYNVLQNSTTLEKVYMSYGVTTIDDSTFSNCTALKEVILPNSVKSLGDSTFNKCSSLENIVFPNSLVSIGDHCFAQCTSIKSINIPASVREVGPSAFMQVPLESITINSNGSTLSFGAGALECTKVKNVYFNGSIEDWCESIELDYNDATGTGNPLYGGANLYINGSSIEYLTIPSTVENIRPGAFIKCANIIDVVIEDGVKTIGDKAFFRSTIEKISIPESVTNIGTCAFELSALTIVYYRAIDCDATKAFANTNAMTSFTTIYIGDKVEKLYDNMFYNVRNLTNVYYEGSEEQWNLIDKGSNNQLTNNTPTYNHSF